MVRRAGLRISRGQSGRCPNPHTRRQLTDEANSGGHQAGEGRGRAGGFPRQVGCFSREAAQKGDKCPLFYEGRSRP